MINTMDNLSQFIADYSESDGARVAFAWNGKHADEFLDSNHDFRKIVLEATLANPDAAPLALIRDLFRAETEWSREAWCVDQRVADLAELLLSRGRADCVMDFLRGKCQSFDASMACGGMRIDPLLAAELLQEVQSRLKVCRDKTEKHLLGVGREVFAEQCSTLNRTRRPWWKFW